MPDIVKDLWTFVVSVGENWVTILAGCMATVMVGLFEKYALKRKLSGRAELFALLCFLFFAAFQAWRVEYKKTTPGIILQIDSAGTGTINDGSTGALLFISVTNRGAPSIVDEWNLTLTVPGQAAKQFVPMMVDPSGSVTFSDHFGHTATYDARDAIYKKTADTPLPTGGKETGYLGIPLPGISTEMANSAGTVYEVSCQDAYANKFHASYIWKRQQTNNPVPAFPGMTEPKLK